MPIYQPLQPLDIQQIEGPGQLVDVENLPEASGSVELEDGSVEVTFGDEAPETPPEVEHGDNLALYLEESVLGEIASKCVSEYEEDARSRADWQKTVANGMDLLGFKFEDRTKPWNGACGVYHPILTEAIVRFQSNAIMEIFPAAGPVRVKVVGRETDEVIEQAKRVQDDMNYQLTERMVEYRDETEQLLFFLPFMGSAMRKVWYDPTLERPVATFVPADDVVVPYSASDIRTASRVTHVMRKSAHEVQKLVAVGFYRPCELSPPSITGETTQLQEKRDRLDGEAPQYTYDDRYILLEMQTCLEIPGVDEDSDFPSPYVVTIEKGTQKVLSIRRNWNEGDWRKQRLQHIVHYKYMPGLGFYGLGLVHLIGGIAKSATSLLRQLVDAGTLSNLPAGFKTRGFRVKDAAQPLMPGEFRDVDIMGGELKENIHMLPFKEPSAVLLQLLTGLVDEGRRFASIADIEVGDMGAQNAPVGSVLALLERALKVQSAVTARLYAAQKEELKLIAGMVKDHMSEQEYEYDTGEDGAIKKQDYDGRVDVIPVSDPNASTMAMKVVTLQVMTELAKSAPQLYDLGELHREIASSLGMQNVDRFIPGTDKGKPMDPVAENMAIINMKPVQAFIWQDHEAHIAAHMAAMQDPKITQMVGQSPNAAGIMGAAEAHVREHVAFQYRREIEKQLGAELPDPEEVLPGDVEVRLSKLVAQAADRVLQKDVKEQQAKAAAEKAEDPVIQIQMGELRNREAETERKTRKDQMDHQIELRRLEIEAGRARSQAGERIADLTVREKDSQRRAQTQRESTAMKTAVDLTKIATDANKPKGNDRGRGRNPPPS